jgi:hypothetical protein
MGKKKPLLEERHVTRGSPSVSMSLARVARLLSIRRRSSSSAVASISRITSATTASSVDEGEKAPVSNVVGVGVSGSPAAASSSNFACSSCKCKILAASITTVDTL